MTKNETNAPLSPVLFLSHSGGPMPLLGDATHHQLIQFTQEITQTFAKPSANLVIRAHWEDPTHYYQRGVPIIDLRL